MDKATVGARVKIHYTVKLEDGKVVGTSKGGQPLSFTIGKGKVLKGLENGVIGMEPGESRRIEISAEQGYGPRNENLVLELDREKLPKEMPLEAGRTVQFMSETNEVVNLMVMDVREKSVVVDANHPFAGQPLVYEVVMLTVS